MDEHDVLAEQFEENRTRLWAVAYRMLSSLGEADDLQAVGERQGQVPLQILELGFQGTSPAVELTVAEKIRKVPAQVDIGKTPEVPFAAPPGPLAQNREGEDLAGRERRWATGFPGCRRMGFMPPVVNQDIDGY